MTDGKFKRAAGHPVSVWGGIILMVLPYILDRFIAEPNKEKTEKLQWEEVDGALHRAQVKQWERLREIELRVVRVQTALEYLSSGRRSEARRTVEAPPPEPKPSRRGPETIHLPTLKEIQQKAKDL